ncbi:hypothetical protein [uncultured Stenotrophomonas sp.]|uniref:hypothetical protein n=1 Tax=uncultured Stenotrophomonas sp. TaxID=165438 RepID=UPI0026012E43|nr:hypothetical protein [uncultured Stenotrophomonas sp.]
MPRKGPIFQDHHILEQQVFYNNELLQAQVEVDLIGTKRQPIGHQAPNKLDSSAK